jgi:hypothetical protein
VRLHPGKESDRQRNERRHEQQSDEQILKLGGEQANR